MRDLNCEDLCKVHETVETWGHTEHFICIFHQIPDGNFRENLSEKLFCFLFFSLLFVCFLHFCLLVAMIRGLEILYVC